MASYFVIPDTDQIVYTGDVVLLSEYPQFKWIAQYGWYTYTSKTYKGWYFSSIPDGSVIPSGIVDLAKITIVATNNNSVVPPAAPGRPCCPPEYPPFMPGPMPPAPMPPAPPAPSYPGGIGAEMIMRADMVVDTIAQRDYLNSPFLPDGKVVRVNKDPSGDTRYYQWDAKTMTWADLDVGKEFIKNITNLNANMVTTSTDLEDTDKELTDDTLMTAAAVKKMVKKSIEDSTSWEPDLDNGGSGGSSDGGSTDNPDDPTWEPDLTPVVVKMTIGGNMKTSYKSGETLDISGIDITGYHSDGSTQTISADDCIFGPARGSELDETINTVTVLYKNPDGTKVSSSYEITVDRVVTDIEVSPLPVTAYNAGQTINTLNMKVYAVCNSGKKYEVNTYRITLGSRESDEIYSEDSTLYEYMNRIIVTYKEDGNTFVKEIPISVAPVVSGIKLDISKMKTNYVAGEALDTSQLKANLTYSSGKTEDVSAMITTEPANGTILYEDDKNVSVNYKE